MNKFLTCLFFVGTISFAKAQQPQVFVELGGNYNTTKKDYNLLSMNGQKQLSETKQPKISARVGLGLSQHSFIGLSYLWHKNSILTGQSYDQNDFHTSNSETITTKINAFGAFYRYYFLPFNSKKWNIFTEFNPSYQLLTTEFKIERISAYPEYYGQDDQLVEISDKNKTQAIDLDLGAGVSYKIAGNISAQLTFRSLANFNRLTKGGKTTQFSLIDKPLQNTFISLHYAF
ncbi:outer membrane beta-barrel protein [Sphingobacterium sp. LRF_L2]|uniref:outer membrane beta-barrel protein n=1 Tax=Sphingobacterium sp. LRF_L2 TaxID=3369421 RepID=UPI003F5FA412